MAKTTDRQIVNGETFMIMDVEARSAISELNYLANSNSIMISGSAVVADGTLVYNANYCHLIFLVTDQSQVYVSGYDYGPNYPLCVFFDEEKNVIGTFTKGGANHMELVDVPNGTEYIYINGNLKETEAVIIPQVMEAAYNSSIMERVRELEDRISKVKPATEAENVLGKAIKNDGTETEGNNYCYKKYQLNGEKYIRCSGYNHGDTWPLCVYMDDDGNVVGQSFRQVPGRNVLTTEIVPAGATQVFVNGFMTDSRQVEPKIYITADSGEIWNYIMSMFEEVKYEDIILGSAYNVTSNSESKGDGFVYVTYKVSNDDILLVDGHDYGTNWPLGAFVDASRHTISTIGQASNVIGLLTLVPADADRLIVNGKIADPMKYPHIYRLVSKNRTRDTHNYTYGTTKKRRAYSLTEAFQKWFFGYKFPICILGDSTTDGDTTTGSTPNQIGTDHQDPNTYTTKLQALLREATGNNNIRIYNGGFSGKSALWTLRNIDGILWNNEYYRDARIVIISHGINDYVPDSLNNVGNYEYALRGLIQNIFDHDAQPVLMTHQSGMENYGRFGWKQMALADEITRNLADEYNLEVMDKNYFTNLFNIYSKYSVNDIIPDGCHYKDVGHEFVAGWMFKELIPYTIPVGDEQTIVSFADERVKTGLEYSSFSGYKWKDVKVITPANGFKLEARCTKDSTTTLMDAWVFIEAKGQKNVVSFCTTPNVQTVTIDGIAYSITEPEQELAEIDIGLHHIVVTSGANENVNYLGLKII